MRKSAFTPFIVGVLLPISLTTVHGTTILYEVTDLNDSTEGEDLWQYTYYISDHTFDANNGFTIYFDHELCRDVGDLVPENGDGNVDTIEWQPDTAIPDDGACDAMSLVDGASMAGPFTASFVWLGEGTPGEQRFEIYDPDFNTLESGQTAPKPEALQMQDFRIKSAKIKPNRKAEGYIAKITGYFQLTSDKGDVSRDDVVFTIGISTYTETLAEKKTKWFYKRPKGVSDPDTKAIRKLMITWDKKNPNKKAKKFTINTDTAKIFPPDQVVVGAGEVDVTVGLRFGLENGEQAEEGSETIKMTEKKGKMKYKKPKPGK